MKTRLLLAMVLFAACGGGGGDGEENDATPTPTAVTPGGRAPAIAGTPRSAQEVLGFHTATPRPGEPTATPAPPTATPPPAPTATPCHDNRDPEHCKFNDGDPNPPDAP